MIAGTLAGAFLFAETQMNGGQKVKKDYVILNIEKEYPGFTGTEKWMIITDLTEKEFSELYPDKYHCWNKAVVVNTEIGKAIVRFKNNDRKQIWRESAGLVSIDEDEDALYVEDPDAVASMTRLWIKDAMDTLTDKQKTRIQRYYLLGYSLKEIALAENKSVVTIHKSIQIGLRKMRQYYENHLVNLEVNVDV